ncbi:MAG: hypothetical protein K8823_1418 [Cenarchaeum symbiont of Oopsacas minuta]|nr:hypothetical protein [Cenarchaeum symbiont of Oopsacas minuta]
MTTIKTELIIIIERKRDHMEDIRNRYESLEYIVRELKQYTNQTSDTTFNIGVDVDNPITYKITTDIFLEKKNFDNIDKILDDVVNELKNRNKGRIVICYYVPVARVI